MATNKNVGDGEKTWEPHLSMYYGRENVGDGDEAQTQRSQPSADGPGNEAVDAVAAPSPTHHAMSQWNPPPEDVIREILGWAGTGSVALDQLLTELQQVKAERDEWRGKAMAMADLDPWIAEQCGVAPQEDKG